MTVPVGVPAPGGFTVTVAVRVVGCPNVDGFGADVSVVVVGARSTVWVREPLLGAEYTSPA
jgi:hypothetical protein